MAFLQAMRLQRAKSWDSISERISPYLLSFFDWLFAESNLPQPAC